MSSLIDVRWLFLFPVALILLIIAWMLRNLGREIWAEKRQWMVTYRESNVKLDRAGSPPVRS
jgi:hypothetical protein